MDAVTEPSRASAGGPRRPNETGTRTNKMRQTRPTQTKSGRQADFLAAHKACRRLSNAFLQLDLRVRVAAMGALRVGDFVDGGVEETAGLAPVRVIALTEFWDDLCRLERALGGAVSGRERPAFEDDAANRASLRDKLVTLHFPGDEAGQALRSAEEWIRRMVAGQDPTMGAARHRAFSGAAAAARRLTTLLGRLDGEKLAGRLAVSDPASPCSAVGQAARHGESSQVPQAGVSPEEINRRLDQLARLRRRLSRVADSLGVLAGREPAPQRGAPSLPDSLIFAVDCLAVIWRRFRSDVPLTGSRNRGGFGEFACAFLNAPPFDFPTEATNTAVRYHVANARRRAQSDGQPGSTGRSATR
jgi:hypothetical protein